MASDEEGPGLEAGVLFEGGRDVRACIVAVQQIVVGDWSRLALSYGYVRPRCILGNCYDVRSGIRITVTAKGATSLLAL